MVRGQRVRVAANPTQAGVVGRVDGGDVLVVFDDGYGEDRAEWLGGHQLEVVE